MKTPITENLQPWVPATRRRSARSAHDGCRSWCSNNGDCRMPPASARLLEGITPWPSDSSTSSPRSAIGVLKATTVHEKHVLNRRLGSAVPPCPAAVSTIASTASRRSREMQSKTCAVVLASAIVRAVNRAHLACVRSMTMMVSDRTMQAAVSSLNLGLF